MGFDVTTYNYTTGIPDGNHLPAQDFANMQTNTNSINSIIGTDHLTFGTATGLQIDGMHTNIRFGTSQGGDPTKINNIGQLYTKTLTIGNTDQCLFFEGGGGRITQLTGIIGGLGNQTSAMQNGYTPLTGGIILQWGKKHLSTSSGTDVLFNVAFPNNAFNVTATFIDYGASGNQTMTVAITDKTKFNVTMSVSGFGDIFWVAIGN